MSIKNQAIKQRIELNGGRAIIEYENQDLAIEDSDQKITILFRGQEVMNFTENWVGIIAARVMAEAGEHGLI